MENGGSVKATGAQNRQITNLSVGTMSPRQFSIGIALVVFAINLVVMAYAGINLERSWATQVAEAEKRTRTIAYAVDQSISSNVDKIDISLQTVVNEVEEQLNMPHLQRNLLVTVLQQQVKLLPESVGFRVSDAKGKLVAGLGVHSSNELDISQREYFLALKANPSLGLYVSKPIISNVSHEWIIPFARRLKDKQGRFAGVVSVPITLAYFNQLLTRFEVGTTGATALRDRDLGLIARFPPDSKGQKLEVGSSNISQAMQELAKSGVRENTYSTEAPYDGTVRVNTFHRISNAPFFVIAGVGREEFLQSWYRELWQTLAFLLVFALVTTSSGWLVYRFWREQVRALAHLREGHAQLEVAFAEIANRDRALVAAQEAGSLGTYTLDLASGIWFCSAELDSLLGFNAQDLHSIETWQDCVHPDDREEMTEYFNLEVLGRRQVFDREYRIVRKNDGVVSWMHGLGKLELAADGRPVRMNGVIQDVSERKFAEERLILMREAFLHSVEGIIVTDRDAVILEVNKAFVDISGYAHDEVLGRKPSLFKSGLQPHSFYKEMWANLIASGYWEGEFQNKRKDGSLYIQFMRISAIRNEKNEITRFIGLASDVTELRESQMRVEYLAYHDRLTNLPNRTLLADRMALAIAQANRREELLAVCYLDLDGFKPINDAWGHDIGDQMLIEVGQRLQSCVRAGDTVARMGGDEFVVLLGNIRENAEIEQAVQRMLTAIADPFQIDSTATNLTMSVGVTVYPSDDADDADTLIRHADQAMYIAKRTGKNRMHLFDQESDRRLKEHHDLFSRVAAALAHNEFRLYYQPKVDMRTGEVVGAEALIRWKHPEQGLILPSVFLPVMENTELAITLGEWVMREALRQMGEWAEAGLLMPVSVNIFGNHLQRPNFVSRLASILAEFPEIKPFMLELEILETTAMDDLDQVSHLINECMELGVSFALDDFGTGYSSLTYFRRLPVSLLKIDRSFVMDMLQDPSDLALVEGIIGLARSLQRRVIAEGVETIEHGIPLLRFGCDLAQGFGIARPMPADKLPIWVQDWTLPDAWKKIGKH